MKSVLIVIFLIALLARGQVHGASYTTEGLDPEFEEFLEIQTELFTKHKLKHEAMESTMQSNMEFISNLSVVMSELVLKIHHLQSQIGAMEAKLQQTESKANGALEKYQSCITNIKFGAEERSQVFEGPGYADRKSYVITGVTNVNSDRYLDGAHRRRYLIHRNGEWTEPLWE